MVVYSKLGSRMKHSHRNGIVEDDHVIAHKASLLNIDGPSQPNVCRGRANADAVDSMYDLPRPSSDVPDRDV